MYVCVYYFHMYVCELVGTRWVQAYIHALFISDPFSFHCDNFTTAAYVFSRLASQSFCRVRYDISTTGACADVMS